MRLLYLSVHAPLEFDELSILRDEGFDVFSPGSEPAPVGPDGGDATLLLRPPVAGLSHDLDTVRAWREICLADSSVDPKLRIPAAFLRRFDAVVVMHEPSILEGLLASGIQGAAAGGSGPRILWRSIGQSTPRVERRISVARDRGVEVVRYSPAERNIPDFAGEDWLVRFAKDADAYGGWTGEERHVITCGQRVRERQRHCHYDRIEAVTRGFDRRLVGPGNRDVPWSVGALPFDEQRRALRRARVYLHTGTLPASYTLGFLEAWMTGIPVVSIGPRLGGPDWGPRVFEVSDLIESGVDGFWSDDVEELRGFVARLLADLDLAREIGRRGREKAAGLFGRTSVAREWRRMLHREPVPGV